ncbi:MAG: hypothetical protein AB7E47_02390 [Desulfovibrionaceae bacterium]
MASKVGIANAALVELGQDRITSLDQDTEAARVVNDVYDELRLTLLQEHPWNFATRRRELPLLAETPYFGYAAAFELPVDCLRVLATNPETTEYRIEGRKLLCNRKQVSIQYVGDVTDSNLMPPTFRAALAALIAAKVAPKLSPDKKGDMEVLASRSKAAARSADSTGGGSVQAVRPNAYVASRRGRVGSNEEDA